MPEEERDGVKKIFLMGRSESGKTTLTQALKGEKIRYHKTQYTNAYDIIIDSPGEYAETKRCGVGLACFSFEADVQVLLMAADEPFPVFECNCNCWTNRPMIGVITRINSPKANVPMVMEWMRNSCAERVFPVDSVTGEGIKEFLEYLRGAPKHFTLQEMKERQAKGLNEWDDPIMYQYINDYVPGMNEEETVSFRKEA